MLTEAEKMWLEKRERRREKFGYYINLYDFIGRTIYSMIEVRDFEDAGMFEYFVSCNLTSGNIINDACYKYYNNCMHDCRACRLKYARIKAEQEMEETEEGWTNVR